MISRALIWGLIVLFLVLVLLLGVGAGFYTDLLWYESLGYVDVLWTRVRAQALLFALGTGIAFASAA
ncbi:MAG: hypothetical protein C4345_12850, partial [Chloroflexota bacterium]